MTTVFAAAAEPPRLSAHSAIKLRTPTIPTSFVVRTRLIEQLDAAGPGGVIAVHGPAGSGKTSLVVDWVSTLTHPTSWYTLDRRDQEPGEFWTNLLAAIDRLRPGCLGALGPLVGAGASSEQIVEELVVALDAASADAATLVLDDLHVIADVPELIAVVHELVRLLPAGLQLVIVSRFLPPLSLDRERVAGRATTVGFDDLRFSSAEAVELLGRLVPDVDDAWVTGTIDRVDGWAAGLQLFALATRSAVVDELDADPGNEWTAPAMQITTDYLVAEAFRDEADELVELLRDIAVVGRVTVPLARSLSGREDAGVLLHGAFERDLFVARRGHGWYELHALVRDVLLEQLEQQQPDRARALHARAAAWFEADQEFPAALEHWALASRHRDALRLLSEVHLGLYDSGRHDVVRRAMQALPVDAYATDFAAMLDFTWCQVLVDRSRFLDGVARLSWWAQRSSVPALLGARLMLLQSVARTVEGDWVGAGRLARQAMTELGADWLLDAYGRFGFNMMARDVALAERWHDDDGDVRRADFELAHDPVRRMSFEGIRALGEALAGQPLAALQTAAGVRQIADVANMAILRDELSLADLVARRELGDHDGMVGSLEALARTEVAPTTYIRVRALVELVGAHLDTGATGAALTVLDELRDTVDHLASGAGARSLLARCAADVALASGELDDAERWIASIEDPFWQPIGRAHALLVRLDRDGALDALDLAVPRCIRHDVIHGLLRSLATPDHEEALKHATAAVETAATHGLLQTVASQGAAAVELAERCAWRAPTGWLERLRLVSVNGRGSVGNPSVPVAFLVDPLTERERDVLRFLPSRLTLQEIASELYISMNTLKFHLKVIYRKLDVRSRAEAAEVARQMTSIRTR